MERSSVAVFPVHPGPPARVLLLHRTPARGGFWQPVTGRLEAGETHEDAARRELHEETALRATRIVDLRLETTFTGYDGAAYRERAYAALVASDRFKPSPEHDDARFVPLDEAERLLHWPENREGLRRARDALLGPGTSGF